MASYVVTFVDVIGAFYNVVLNQNRYAVFVWSVDVFFIVIVQIYVLFKRLLYETVILCHCIIKVKR